MQHLHWLEIESVDLEGQGLARADGKVVFVENALLGEIVDAEVTKAKPSYAKARATVWHRESSQRVKPRCPHFGVCGGCAVQHIEPLTQIAIKQRVLEDNLWHIARIKPNQILAPLDGPPWGYRTRARLTARWVDKKGGMLLGFHERKSSYVAVMDSCEILHPRVSQMIPALKEVLGSLSIARRVPQAEVAVGEPEPISHHTKSDPGVMRGMKPGFDCAPRCDSNSSVIVWVLRVLESPSSGDEEKLRAFADEWAVQIWLQPQGPQSAHLFHPPDAPRLCYRLSEFDLVMPFSPVDFTQVNPAINQVMVRRAIQMLQPQSSDRIADFFCGLGNFTLAIARQNAQVVGYEGSVSLLNRAASNAASHGLERQASFEEKNLFEVDENWLMNQGPFTSVLLDPPREGAQALCQAMAAIHQTGDESGVLPSRMVYVSCNPATLARDAAILVHEGGWTLAEAGVINMFPHTAHVESIALFTK